MENNKPDLRKLIKEILGHYMPLDTIAEKYAVMVMNLIRAKSENGKKILSPYDNGLKIEDEKIPEKEEAIHGMGRLLIDIFPSINKTKPKNFVMGAVEKGAIKQFYKDNRFYYPAEIKLCIVNWDYKTDLTAEIKENLSHELFHAFEHIKEINGNGYSIALNNARNDVKGLKYDENVQQLKDFMEIFYLSLPNEITARVHEAYDQMENLKLNFHAKSHDEVLQELNKLSVFRDFLRVQNFGEYVVLDLAEDIKKDFVNKFNVKLKQYKDEYKVSSIKIINEPDEFFKYWIGRAKRFGLEARHKIVAQAINLFAGKEIVTEYSTTKFKIGYVEQLYEEILHNLDGHSSNAIYQFSLSNSICEAIEDSFLEEIHNYSNFVL